ncbi:hypothetical protein [Bradyrhizobium centrosematis]|uniref:hypothetical protein n=1 Tax=Bradyrhizobium centrosematis TaxID=1300039 RepID=UPI00388F94CD
MIVEQIGHMKPFKDLENGTLFYRGNLGIKVTIDSHSSVLVLEAGPKAVMYDGNDLANRSVLVLNKPVFQVKNDLALWHFGVPKGPVTGIVVVSADGQRLRAHHESGEYDIDLATGIGHRINADENVSWTAAWRVVSKSGFEQETALLQSSEWER